MPPEHPSHFDNNDDNNDPQPTPEEQQKIKDYFKEVDKSQETGKNVWSSGDELEETEEESK